MKKMLTAVSLIFIIPAMLLFSQTHISVPLDDPVYYILDSAQLKGLCNPLPMAKPYSEETVRRAINEIFVKVSALSAVEADILKDCLSRLNRQEGFDLQRGAYYHEAPIGENSHYSWDIGLKWTSELSMNLARPFAFGTTNMGTLYMSGDIGNTFSYDFNVSGGILDIDRTLQGTIIDPEGATHPEDASHDVWELPAYFPYTFSKVWDVAVFKPSGLASYDSWPDEFAFGYSFISEMDASFADNRIQLRFGRMRRDWGPAGNGASLVLNQNARPFVAIEGTMKPTDWLNFSFLTGVLEFHKVNSIDGDAERFQNAYSMVMVEANYKDYFHFDAGSACVWPKRFELGYIFPLNSNFFYQNNIGNFDNLALFTDIYGQFPGIGRIWFSAFVDEFNLTSKPFFSLNRNEYAFQAGTKLNVPWVPFGSVTLQYTKIEPYCYTHFPVSVPWYGNVAGDGNIKMYESFVNNGDPLGYYLKPNSDELLVRFEMMPLVGLQTHFQYQMIRHGADFGPYRVGGSSYYDWQDEYGDSEKHFLKDGAYQWQHVLKAGGEYSLKQFRVPVSVFGEFGVVFSYYTIDLSERNKADIVSTDPYTDSTRVILSIGVKIFP